MVISAHSAAGMTMMGVREVFFDRDEPSVDAGDAPEAGETGTEEPRELDPCCDTGSFCEGLLPRPAKNEL